ncbi:MAG: methyltransferase domain-containing protein [Actinomycetota bacterium]|nr:methyltransferase domain-containing protein [Actinomycetota bacterium]
MTRDWDAATYERVSGPQLSWSGEVIDRLELQGDETVLDAGCGSGRVTRLLLERLPRGHVIAVDAAPSMVEFARESLGERATVFQSDLQDLVLDEPVDAVFSNAVFHWVPDHDLLFRRMYDALRPGGRMSAQCGGEGNVERFHGITATVAAEEPYAKHLGGWAGPWNFAGAEETAKRLRRVGFTDVEAWLHPAPVTPDEPADFIRTVCLGYHLPRLPEELRDPYVAAVAGRLGQRPVIDYVRLNIVARRD